MQTFFDTHAIAWRRRMRWLVGGTVNLCGGCVLLHGLLSALS